VTGSPGQLVSGEAAESRQHTMRVRALRRLSKCELGGLGIALDHLEVVETALVEALPKMRQAAEKEAAVRHARGLPVVGPYVASWSAVRELLLVVTDAREEVTHAETSGKVEKRTA
jgi:hypothetical protein